MKIIITFIISKNMKKLFTIATLFSVLHFFHDAILVAIGRYTEINIICRSFINFLKCMYPSEFKDLITHK